MVLVDSSRKDLTGQDSRIFSLGVAVTAGPCPDGGLGFFSEDNSILHFDSIECEAEVFFLGQLRQKNLLLGTCKLVQLLVNVDEETDLKHPISFTYKWLPPADDKDEDRRQPKGLNFLHDANLPVIYKQAFNIYWTR
ncbi:hypothetical protein VPH35_066516 [Triticum aestivum]